MLKIVLGNFGWIAKMKIQRRQDIIYCLDMSKASSIEEISNYRIRKSQPLGQGACGAVYYGQSKDGMKVAVKIIDINKLTDHIEKQIKSEITTLKSISSPFIVKMHDCFRSGQHLYIVLEFCEDGDLKRYLDKFRVAKGISENEAITFMRHLMSGYNVLLQRKVIHRDIKPANILLRQGVAKLSDFGFSRVVDDPTKTQKLSCLGTPLYTAPEVLARQQFSNSCDVWSMGIVFYEMLHGKAPWTGTDIQNLYNNIKNHKLEFKPNINPNIKDLISKMLTVDRHSRISWQNLMQHPIFAQPIDLGPQKPKKEINYAEAKHTMMQYLKTYLVKSYLLLNTNAQVNFAPNEEAIEAQGQKSDKQLMVEKETSNITFRRNYAFLHIYVLALYWRNKDKKVLPPNLNYYMEFEYGLIGRAFNLISQLGQDFNLNNQQGSPEWLHYRKTPHYAELTQLLEKDYTLLGLLFKTCRKDIDEKMSKGSLHPDTANYMKKYDENFMKVFNKAMDFNLSILKNQPKKSGVTSLIGQYIEHNILKQDNTQSNFASLYEQRERDYGLN